MVKDMKLIEKKCPNCGASLEIGENDKTCKCKYCHSVFQVERDEKEKDDIEKSIQLKKLEGPLKVFGLYFIGSYIVSGIIFLLVFIFIGIMIFAGIKSTEKVLIKNVSELSNANYGDLDNKAYWVINKNDDGIHDYHLNLNVKRQKVYVGYNKKNKKNIIISVYKATYEKMLDKENIYTIYVPIVYENIYKNNSIIFQLDNGKVEAPEYYFNLEHSEYSYGYQSIDDVDEKFINDLEKDYEITKK